jgi:hypothetical protein
VCVKSVSSLILLLKGAYTKSGDSNHILTEFVYGTVPVYKTGGKKGAYTKSGDSNHILTLK